MLGAVGRVTLWGVLLVVLVRGISGTFAVPDAPKPLPARAVADQAADALAVRFARAYLADPSSPALAGFLAEGARLGAGLPPGSGATVAQAEVSATEELPGGRAILTVACDLRDARTLYLAVPIARTTAGEVAVLGAPSLVAEPGVAGVEADRPRPLAGNSAGEIAALARRFMPEFLEADRAGDLAYVVAPGAVIEPLGGALRLARVASVEQLGSGEGARREVLVGVRAIDPSNGAVYPLTYRLQVKRGARWYVTALGGGELS